MNRRELLKNLGLGAGFLVVGPTTFGLLQSCKNEPNYDWQPTFLSPANGFALKQVLEVILPATDIPGANDLNLAQFIDSYMEEVAPEERQERFKAGANAFANAFKDETGKGLDEGTQEEYDQVIKKYLLATPAEREEMVQRNTETQDPMDADPDETMSSVDNTYDYLQNVREMGIWAWKNSEEIGENVMWYDPIPGVYIPCGTMDELGNNGKAMSL
ncbi:hypothetical protein GCM10007103_24250 [Salinimicrobium marinum]|uniref:Gluconate 2-dehydrogenase subunit 3 n=1 Tax=Salinimicrobium marinum TaxID=680283 RepID=A0A918VZX9_9FLAO|nr:gluconate 2-dehydrogenase subunit 3 family protein [Salinimicrobium marinum]GHA42080.1 hypothetical protein GCM10007103_24250 [Salinimicrobium marinum]